MPNYNSQQPISATNNPAPMPVQWLYLLKDGTLTSPDQPAAGTAATTATWKATSDPSKIPTTTNPIVGRIAFWTDDETSKLNVNTASEGSFYAFPHSNSPMEMLGPPKVKAFGYSISPPATGEHNRYPGHPASTCLSVALGSWFDAKGSPAPTAYTSVTSDQAYLSALQNYTTLLPRIQFGGSKGGTIDASDPKSGYTTVTLDKDRLFASTDELMFDQSRNPIPQIQNINLERLKFFLTASSRAPELTPFNTPKVSMWPQWKAQADRTAAGATRGLLAFCSTFGQPNSDPTALASTRCEYFVQRTSKTSHTSTTLDWSIPRNQLLANYVYKLGSNPIPGYGAAFVSNAKYTPENFSNLVLESLDFIRSNVSKLDFSVGEGYVAPMVATAGLPGITKTTGPMKGLGDYPVITQVALGQGNLPGSKPGANIPTAFLVFDTFFPSLTMPGANPTINVQIQNAENLGVPGLSGTVNYGLWDWKNNKTQTMRGWGRSLNNPAGGYYSYPYDPSKPSMMIGSAMGQPAVFVFTDGAGNPIQRLSVRFPQTQVPSPADGQAMGSLWYTYGGQVSSMFSLTSDKACSVRSMECGFAAGGTTGGLRGDWRSLAAIYDWTANTANAGQAKDLFTKTLHYSDQPDWSQAHTLRMCNWYDSRTREPTVGNGVASPCTTTTTGTLTSLLVNTDYADYNAPCTPFMMTAPTMANGQPGDWDTGPGLQPDGPYINPVEQTFSIQEGYGLYFNPDTTAQDANGLAFSPNRAVASPVRFGSLPTGISTTTPKPWQTLLFCPNPAGRMAPASATPSSADHPGFATLTDHV